MARPIAEREELALHISGTTAMLGLIGTPVEHSQSPAMYKHLSLIHISEPTRH